MNGDPEDDSALDDDVLPFFEPLRDLIRFVEKLRSADWSFVAHNLEDAITEIRRLSQLPSLEGLQDHHRKVTDLEYVLAGIVNQPWPNLSQEQTSGLWSRIEDAIAATRSRAKWVKAKRADMERAYEGAEQIQVKFVAKKPKLTRPPLETLGKTKRQIISMCRKKGLPGTAIARALELSPDHTRRVLAELVRVGWLKNGETGYRTRAT